MKKFSLNFILVKWTFTLITLSITMVISAQNTEQITTTDFEQRDEKLLIFFRCLTMHRN